MGEKPTYDQMKTELSVAKGQRTKAENDLARANTHIEDLGKKLAAMTSDRDASRAHAKRCEQRANESVATIERLQREAAVVCGGSFVAKRVIDDEVLGYVTPASGRQPFEVTDAVAHGTARLGPSEHTKSIDDQGAEAIEQLAAAENRVAELEKELADLLDEEPQDDEEVDASTEDDDPDKTQVKK